MNVPVRRRHETWEPETNIQHRQVRDRSDDYDAALTAAGIRFDDADPPAE